jgi:hypothetical protein
MLVGIEKWLPLYLSGLVEGYYCSIPAGPAFSHTLFVAPGAAAVGSSFVSGTDGDAICAYAEGAERVAYFEKQIDALFAISRPLIQVFRKNRSNEYHFLSEEASKTPGDVKRLLLSPSLRPFPAGFLSGCSSAPEPTIKRPGKSLRRGISNPGNSSASLREGA